MRAQHVGLLALALLAGSAGYIAHHYMARRAPDAPAPLTPLAAAPAVAPGAPLEWSFADLAGRGTPLATWRGKLLVLNFWATWCPPCLREIPAFMSLQERYGERGLQFVGIALDEQAAVGPFVAEKAMNYPVLVGNDDVVRFMQALGNQVGGLPYTVVLGRDGSIVLSHQGEWEAAAAAAAIEDLLAED